MKRTAMRRVSKKSAALKLSAAGRADAEWLNAVRQMPCNGCRRHGPNEAHHCRDSPPFDDRALYDNLPGMGMRAADRDAISLCRDCHRMFHLERVEFHGRYGHDYLYIKPTRQHIEYGS